MRRASLLTSVLCAGLISACGGGSSHHRPVHHHPVRPVARVLDIYSSLPLQGPSGAAGRLIVRGIRLALSQAGDRAGSYMIRYRSLDDARAGQGQWDPPQTAANARRAALDSAAVTYIGDFDSSASQISLPILNQAGIPQISPWSPDIGLTDTVGGVTAYGEPGHYYPTGERTFLRLAPDDAVQAAAILEALRAGGCSRLAALDGGTQLYGRELGGLLTLERARYGIAVSRFSLGTVGLNLRRFLLGLRTGLTGCVAYLGEASAAAGPVLAAIHGQLPRASILTSDRLCSAMITDPGLRQTLVNAAGPSLECTFPTVPSDLPATAVFASTWRRAYGPRTSPGVWGTYGYSAMQLALDTITDLGSRADDRRRVLRALLTSRSRTGVLGNYGFDADGDSSLRAYGLYQVRSGEVPLERVLEPALTRGLG